MRKDKKGKFDLRHKELEQLLATPGTTRTALEQAKTKLTKQVYEKAEELYQQAADESNVVDRWGDMSAERGDVRESLSTASAMADAQI